MTKAVIDFMKNEEYLDVIRDKIAKGGPAYAEHAAHFKISAGSWAKWRMGTVRQVSRRVETMWKSFVVMFDPADFNAKDRSAIAKVAEAASSPDYESCNLAVGHIAYETECLRGWFRGCVCHSDECIAARLKGKLFECPDRMKSRVGPFIEAKLHACYDDWSRKAHQLGAQPFCINARVFMEVVIAYENMTAFTKLKNSYIGKFPWLVWKARSNMEYCINRYDHIMGNCPQEAARMHRVAHKF